MALGDEFRKGDRGELRPGQQAGASRVTKEAGAAGAREAKPMHGTPGQEVELELRKCGHGHGDETRNTALHPRPD